MTFLLRCFVALVMQGAVEVDASDEEVKASGCGNGSAIDDKDYNATVGDRWVRVFKVVACAVVLRLRVCSGRCRSN